jgi:RecB family exonuclease
MSAIEAYLREQRADLEVLRMLMMQFLIRVVIGSNPAGAAAALQELRTSVMDAVGRSPPGGIDAADQALLKTRAAEFLDEMSSLLAQATALASGEGARH